MTKCIRTANQLSVNKDGDRPWLAMGYSDGQRRCMNFSHGDFGGTNNYRTSICMVCNIIDCRMYIFVYHIYISGPKRLPCSG